MPWCGLRTCSEPFSTKLPPLIHLRSLFHRYRGQEASHGPITSVIFWLFLHLCFVTAQLFVFVLKDGSIGRCFAIDQVLAASEICTTASSRFVLSRATWHGTKKWSNLQEQGLSREKVPLHTQARHNRTTPNNKHPYWKDIKSVPGGNGLSISLNPRPLKPTPSTPPRRQCPLSHRRKTHGRDARPLPIDAWGVCETVRRGYTRAAVDRRGWV